MQQCTGIIRKGKRLGEQCKQKGKESQSGGPILSYPEGMFCSYHKPNNKRNTCSGVPPPQPPPQRPRLETQQPRIETPTDMHGLGDLHRRAPTEVERNKYLAETEAAVCHDVFGGNKNPKWITADDVRKCIEIIVRLSLGGFGSHIPLTTTLNAAGAFRKAGHCKGSEIAFNTVLLYSYVAVVNGEIGPRNVNGKVCRTIVAILIGVMEHEIIHWLMFHYVPRGVRKAGGRKWASHGTVFMDIARNIFGHTAHCTALSTEVTAQSLTQKTTKVGQKVMVTFRGSEPRPGVVDKVNPIRAKVSVSNRIYTVHYSLMQSVDV